ncbi:MAG: class I SAM-dependent methyltransferase [Cyclobacteriaceae bacterium]
MYEKLEQCPSCGHPKFDNYSICKDHSVSGESFALVTCARCELIFTNPRPEENALGRYYESDSYISHTDRGNSFINFLYKLVRSFTLKKKRRLVEKYVQSGMVLDYGCGTGDFLKECETKGWLSKGVEPDNQARKIAIEKTSGTIVRSVDELKVDKEFDVITAWHVVEHISDLKGTIRKLRKNLKKGGYLIVAVPNAKSADANYYKEYWAAYDVPRHLYHFTKSSFTHLAKSLQFSIIQTEPMKFDSFYVSMLSEKYKSGHHSLIKGFINGWKSNVKASGTGEYSSLIYILKK